MRHGTGETAATRAVGVHTDEEPATRLVPVQDLPGTGPDGDPALWPSPVAARRGSGSRPTPFSQPGLQQFANLSVGEIAERAGLKRIDLVAWRDFEDPEAGGSELHAHRVMTAWAKAGIDVSMTTSSVPDGRTVVRRDGYRVVRRSGRYAVFPRTMLSGALGRIGSGDGLVEIWNGMPFFSPLWAHCPHIVFLHHVHAEMWKMVLPAGMAESGYAIEHRVAPPVYRRTRIVTLSSSSKREIVDLLGIPGPRVSVTPPGVEPQFSPGGERSDVPLVAAVGRLVPVKRLHLLVQALVELKPGHPGLQAVIAGEGYERPALEAQIRAAGAESWISLPGFLSEEDLIDLYRRAWVVASTSLREGWGMTLTEAGACGTPSVVSRISGHEDAVRDRITGILVDRPDQFAGAIDAVLRDDVLRKQLGMAALDHSSQFTWDATARGTLAALGAEVLAKR